MVVIDTSIIIDHLRQPPGRKTLLIALLEHIPKKDLALSVISVQELYEGRSTRTVQEEDYLLITVSQFSILVHTFEMAKRAGTLVRDSSRPIEFADAAIAACAIINDASLYTLNTKDFTDIPGLEFYSYE